MAKSMAATIARMDAQRLQMEAERNTPEGRRKAVEMELAEIEEKKSNWAFRAILDRENGWKPIWGNAEDEELHIYTLLDSGEHRFWGVKPVGLNIHDFWDKCDPKVKRYDDMQQETPIDPYAPTGPIIGEPPRSQTSKRAAMKPVKRQKTPEITSNQRVRKSKKQPRKPIKNTRKSLAHKIDAAPSVIEEQVRVVEGEGEVRARGRPVRNKAVMTVSGAERKPAKGQSSVQDDIPSQPKRPRGRPPATEKRAERRSNQNKTSVVQRNAKVTKSSRKELRPPAPSTHKMRTRRAGPAESLQLP